MRLSLDNQCPAAESAPTVAKSVPCRRGFSEMAAWHLSEWSRMWLGSALSQDTRQQRRHGKGSSWTEQARAQQDQGMRHIAVEVLAMLSSGILTVRAVAHPSRLRPQV